MFIKIINNEKGIALITTLAFSLISITFISIATYMVLSGTKVSGLENRYLSTLDIAKGVSSYAMNSIDNIVKKRLDISTIIDGGLVIGTVDNCSTYDTCNRMQNNIKTQLYPTNSKCINLTKDNIDLFGGYDSCVELLSTAIDPITGGVLFGIEITTQNRNNRLEKSILQLVYLR